MKASRIQAVEMARSDSRSPDPSPGRQDGRRGARVLPGSRSSRRGGRPATGEAAPPHGQTTT